MVEYTEEEEETSMPTREEAFKEYKLLRKKREEEGSELGATLAGATPLLLGLLTGEVATGMQAAGQTVSQFAAQKEKGKDAYEQALLKLATTSDSSRVTPIPYPLSGPEGKPHVGLLNPKSGEVTLVGVPQFVKPEPEKETIVRGATDYYAVKGGKKTALGITPPQPAKKPGPDLTKAEMAVDSKMAKEYSDFKAGGKEATLISNMQSLEDAIAELRAKPGLTGVVEGALHRVGGAYFAPETEKVRALIEGVAAQSLKDILGGAFSEKDREFLLKNSFAPELSQEENADRAERVLRRIQQAYANKMEQFSRYEKYGTFSPRVVGDVNKNAAPAATKGKPSTAPADSKITSEQVSTLRAFIKQNKNNKKDADLVKAATERLKRMGYGIE